MDINDPVFAAAGVDALHSYYQTENSNGKEERG
jgi:hypothetical protein